MAQYTTTIRTICESLFPKNEMSGYNSIDEIINKVHSQIFDFDYEFYEPEHKSNFEKKFLLHFYMREIGLETYGYWKLRLRDKFLTLMPYIKKLYEQTINVNYFDNVDYKQTIKELEKGNTSVNTTSDEKNNAIDTGHISYKNEDIFNKKLKDNRQGSTENSANTDFTDNTTLIQNDTSDSNKNELTKTSDYPQSNLSDFENNIYLSNLNNTHTTDHSTLDSSKRNNTVSNTSQINDSTYKDDINTTEDSVNNSTSQNWNTKDSTANKNKDSLSTTFTNTDNDKINTVKGKKGGLSYIELISMYQKAILNYDEIIFNQCEDLFMQCIKW